MYTTYSDFKDRPSLLELNISHFDHDSGLRQFEKVHDKRSHKPSASQASNVIYTTKEWLNRFANPSRTVSIRNELDVPIYVCWRDGIWQAVYPTTIAKKRNKVFIKCCVNAEVCETNTPQQYYKELVEANLVADEFKFNDVYNKQITASFDENVGKSKSGGIISTEAAITIEEIRKELNGVYIKEFDVMISAIPLFPKVPHPYSNPNVQFASRQDRQSEETGHGLHIRYQVVDKEYKYEHMFMSVGGTVEPLPIDRVSIKGDGVYVIKSRVTLSVINSESSNTFFSTLGGHVTDVYSFEEAANILHIYPTRDMAANGNYDVRRKQLELDLANLALKEKDISQKRLELDAKLGETVYKTVNETKRSVLENQRFDKDNRHAEQARRDEQARQYDKDRADKVRYRRDVASDTLKILGTCIAAATALLVLVNKQSK